MARPGDGLLHVRIIKDDVGALSTELESDLLQVGLGGSLHDLTANESATSECDLYVIEGNEIRK